MILQLMEGINIDLYLCSSNGKIVNAIALATANAIVITSIGRIIYFKCSLLRT